MIHVIAKKQVVKENQAKFLDIAKEQVDCTRKEDGCISYDLTACHYDENILVYVERWESRAHLDAHLQSEHIVRLRPSLNELCTGTELLILEDAYL